MSDEQITLLWLEDYETGNEQIDSEHKQLFQLTEKLINADFSDRGAKIHTAVNFLTDYVLKHFGHEEGLMAECTYPKTAEHKQEHIDLQEIVGKLKERIANEGETIKLSRAVNDSIVSWLTGHIMGSDKALADYYKQWKEKN